MALASHIIFFIVIGPIQSLDSECSVMTIMKISLQHGICHIVLYGTNSKLKLHFERGLKLLKLNNHTITKGNHSNMLLESFYCYLNKGL